MPFRSISSCFFLLSLVLLINSCKTANPSASQGQVEQHINTNDEDEVSSTDDPEEEEPGLPMIYQASRSRIWDLLHTKLELSFNWYEQSVNGIAFLELRPYFYPQNSLVLDAKGFDILKVSRLTSEGQYDQIFQYDSLRLKVLLDKEFNRREKVLLKIEYVAFPGLREGGSQAISSDKGLYFINPLGQEEGKPQQIWTQGETESNSAWFPTIDSPNERCTQEMFITVNKKFRTLSNGKLVYSKVNEDSTRTDYWKMDKPHAPYLFMMAIGEYVVVEDKWRSVPLQYWVEPEYEQYADDIFGNTPEMMEYFSQLFDYEYPWSKYSQVVVRDYVSGAMENTTASVFMEDLQVTDRELLDENWDYIIAHELVHQWFGDLVTCESWSNLPLNEGFATYGEYLWNEYKYGLDEAEYNHWIELQNYLSEAETKQVPLIRYFYEDREDMFDSHSYSKAGRVLHMLRKYVGDEAFFASLNHYLRENAFSSVEIDDLRRAFEKTTGEDLNWFFDQWFLTAGHPVLEVTKEYVADSLILSVYQLQDTTTNPVYKLPLYIDVYTEDGIDIYPLIIEEMSQRFSFYYPESPKLVIFDSDRQLLGEINFLKSSEELYYQYVNAGDFVSRYFALYQISDSENDSLRKDLYRRALADSSWRIRSEAIDLMVEYGYHTDPDITSLLVNSAEDDRSGVRTSALSALSDVYAEHKGFILKGIRDKSYSVAGVSLSAYLQNESDPEPSIIEEFSKEQGIEIVAPMAEYFLAQNDHSQYGWFTGKLNTLKGTDLYYFLQYFSQYLITAPEGQKVNTIEPLFEMALNASQYYIRLGAFQALSVISDIAGVDEKIETIKANESDPRLIYIYENLEVTIESEN